MKKHYNSESARMRALKYFENTLDISEGCADFFYTLISLEKRPIGKVANNRRVAYA